MARNRDASPFTDDESSARQILQGLISPAPAQSLVMPPPDTPPRSGPGESTPLTGNLRSAPSQATPKIAPAPEDDHAASSRKTRRGLAGYFSAATGVKASKAAQIVGKEAGFQRETRGATNRPNQQYKAARDKQLAGRKADRDEAKTKKENDPAMANLNSRNVQADLVKGSAVRLPDGTSATVSYLDRNMRIVRVRTSDGRNLTLRLAQLRLP